MYSKPIKRNLGVRFKILKGKSYLIKDDEMFELDTVGECIWESIDGKKNYEDICYIILKKYNVTSKEVHSDVKNLLEDLEFYELISIK